MQQQSYTIDKTLIQQAMQSTGLDNEQAVIEQGLSLLITWHAQQELRTLKGKLTWDGDLSAMRGDERTKPWLW